MREGMYLGAPPVNVRRAGARRFHFSLMRGGATYSQAAGGFGTVPAFPPTLQRFKAPASVNRDVNMVELYAQSPGLFHQRLQAQFRTPRARVTAGQLRPLVPQVPPDDVF
jgi:hypothetical protein